MVLLVVEVNCSLHKAICSKMTFKLSLTRSEGIAQRSCFNQIVNCRLGKPWEWKLCDEVLRSIARLVNLKWIWKLLKQKKTMAIGLINSTEPDLCSTTEYGNLCRKSCGLCVSSTQSLISSTRSEEHTSELPVTRSSRMPSSAWKKKNKHPSAFDQHSTTYP